ncbi:unnamed protein product [Blepharisma stoltei]|uniref:Uncharacterized protein n=1 Tax=Blepharisma stoltei TaxID=1481888 RepID=A0AAU9J304_9CILI|nr:unnamed protein product [Blepharisma stoltei]
MAEAQLRSCIYEHIHRLPSRSSRAVQTISSSPIKSADTLLERSPIRHPPREDCQISAHVNMYSPIYETPPKPVKVAECGIGTYDENFDLVTGKIKSKYNEKSLDKIMYTNRIRFKTIQEAANDLNTLDNSNKMLRSKIDNLRTYVIKRIDSISHKPQGTLKRILSEAKCVPERRSASVFTGDRGKKLSLFEDSSKPMNKTSKSTFKMVRAKSTLRPYLERTELSSRSTQFARTTSDLKKH